MNTPPMYFGDTTRRGRPYAKDPSVVRFGGRYLLYYSLPPAGEGSTWAIGIAESQDLTHWTPNRRAAAGTGTGRRKRPVRSGGTGHQRIRCICFTRATATGARTPSAMRFRMTESRSRATRPTRSSAPDGDWNAGRAIDAEVFALEDRLLLYYATRDPDMKVQMLGARFGLAPFGLRARRVDLTQPRWPDAGPHPALGRRLH